MKKLIFIILLFTTYSFSQENRIVRQNELSDSLDALRGLIGTGGVALPDSTVFTSELTPYLFKVDTTAQRTFSNLKYATKVITDSLAEDIADINALFYTGTDSIHYGEDSIVVSHGVGSTPRFISIQLVSDGFGFQTWVSGINSLTFYVRRSDTGLKTINSSIQFKWMAYK